MRLCASGLALGLGATLHPLGLRSLQVTGRDPALIVGLSLSARGDGWAIGTDNADLVGGVDLLGALGGALCALATLATALLLREESSDPGAVDEVTGTGEDTSEDKVEEDARNVMSVIVYSEAKVRW